MRQVIAASVVAVSLAVTGGAAVAINQSSPPSLVSSASASPTTVPSQRSSARRGPGGRQSVLSNSLKKLVANGTITQAQADAILAEVAAERKAQRDTFRNHAKGGLTGGAMGILRGATETVANSIGITPDELRTEITNGKSVAEIATAHGVDPATVVAALVSDADARIDALVTKGALTADQAAKMKAGLNKLVEDFVNGKGFGRWAFTYGSDVRGYIQPNGGGSTAPGAQPARPPVSPAPTQPAPTVAPPTTAAPATAAPTTAAPATAAPTTAAPTTSVAG